MPFNGSGTYVLPVNSLSPDATAGTTISSDDFDELTNDIETALTKAICKDGQSNPTANLPMATYRHTGVGDAAALTDYASANQVVDNALTYGGASAAGSDTYAVNLTISPGAYAAGNRFQFIADVANTGACTININSLGAKAIKLADGNDPFNGAIQANAVVDVIYDGTNMLLLNPWDSALSGVTASATELNYLDLSAAVGTASASEAVVLDANKDFDFGTGDITATDITSSGTITDGTATLTGGVLTGDVTGNVTGNADTATATPALQVGGSNGSVKVFVSTPEAYTGGAQALTAEAHGLGAIPNDITVFAKCTDAGGDIGYSQNDVIVVNSISRGTNDYGVQVWADATNVDGYVVTDGLVAANKGTGAITALGTSTDWAIYIVAKYYA